MRLIAKKSDLEYPITNQDVLKSIPPEQSSRLQTTLERQDLLRTYLNNQYPALDS
jgi:hypothetical protein